MWDRAEAAGTHLSHDLPCLGCGHAAHPFLSCSGSCACVPPPLPGSVPLDDRPYDRRGGQPYVQPYVQAA